MGLEGLPAKLVHPGVGGVQFPEGSDLPALLLPFGLVPFAEDANQAARLARRAVGVLGEQVADLGDPQHVAADLAGGRGLFLGGVIKQPALEVLSSLVVLSNPEVPVDLQLRHGAEYFHQEIQGHCQGLLF